MSWSARVVTAGVLVALPARARADEPPRALPPQAATTPSPAPRADRSPNVALLGSLAPTVLGAGLVITAIALQAQSQCSGFAGMIECTNHNNLALGLAVAGGAGFLVGPTLGHLYSGRAWNRGMRTRLIGAGIAVAGLAVVALAPGDGNCRQQICGGALVGGLILVGGGATVVVGTAVEIASAPSAARDHNRRLEPHLTIAPIRTQRSTVPGVAVEGVF